MYHREEREHWFHYNNTLVKQIIIFTFLRDMGQESIWMKIQLIKMKLSMSAILLTSSHLCKLESTEEKLFRSTSLYPFCNYTASSLSSELTEDSSSELWSLIFFLEELGGWSLSPKESDRSEWSCEVPGVGSLSLLQGVSFDNWTFLRSPPCPFLFLVFL